MYMLAALFTLPLSAACTCMHSNKSSVLMQSLLLVWCFILMLRELTVFSTWGVRPFAVGTFLVTATIGTVCYVIYTAYAEMDWRVVSQIKKKRWLGSRFGRWKDVQARGFHPPDGQPQTQGAAARGV